VTARTIKVEGCKAFAEEWIESLDTEHGRTLEKLAEASVLILEASHDVVSDPIEPNLTKVTD
jgi:hypothetical protein